MTETAYVNKVATRDVFHTDPDCQYIRAEYRTWDLETARAWYRHCEHCAGNYQ